MYYLKVKHPTSNTYCNIDYWNCLCNETSRLGGLRYGGHKSGTEISMSVRDAVSSQYRASLEGFVYVQDCTALHQTIRWEWVAEQQWTTLRLLTESDPENYGWTPRVLNCANLKIFLPWLACSDLFERYCFLGSTPLEPIFKHEIHISLKFSADFYFKIVRSELFTFYMLNILKQWHLLPYLNETAIITSPCIITEKNEFVENVWPANSALIINVLTHCVETVKIAWLQSILSVDLVVQR